MVTKQALASFFLKLPHELQIIFFLYFKNYLKCCHKIICTNLRESCKVGSNLIQMERTNQEKKTIYSLHIFILGVVHGNLYIKAWIELPSILSVDTFGRHACCICVCVLTLCISRVGLWMKSDFYTLLVLSCRGMKCVSDQQNSIYSTRKSSVFTK